MAYLRPFAFISLWPIVTPVCMPYVGRIQTTFRTGHQQQGLTLVEILVVLALVVALASVGLPTYANQMSRYQLYGATRQVMSDLLLSQKSALRQKLMIQVLFDDPQHYRIWRDVDDNRKVSLDEITRRDLRAYRVRLNANNNPRFHASGAVTNLPTIMLKHAALEKKQFRCITISIAGRIKQGRCRR